jgi:hypothetical protein
MSVQEIQSILRCHAVHGDGEGQVVRRMFEERIRRDLYLVVEDALDETGEAERLRVRDEMRFVSASGELEAQFRGDDT